MLLGTTLATLLAALVYMLRRRLLGLFTDDAEVLDVALRCSWIMCLTIITDGANVSIEGGALLASATAVHIPDQLAL